jgi:uroporphyrinogen III methyltransferase/synthase
MDSLSPSTTPGTVYLLGAGPGDPELLTLKARRVLEQADAVVYDHLAPQALLDWTRPGCEGHFAGKKAGHFCKPQSETEELLIRLAREGKSVARLKGGDPFIFGRGGEEAQALAAAGIAFEVVPGVTAALGAGAYAGIPLTHRAYASAVVFLTGHEDPAKPSGVMWEDYATLKATLCIYMGIRNLPTICRRLQAGGMSPEMPVAILQAATTAAQKQVTGTISTIAALAAEHSVETPAIVLIGEVVAFSETLAWFGARQSAFSQ